MSISDFEKSLAPTDLKIYRDDRYDGGGIRIAMADLAKEDQQKIQVVYHQVKTISEQWQNSQSENGKTLIRKILVETIGNQQFIEGVRSIGRITYESEEVSDDVHSVMHDVKGGAMFSLIGYAQMLSKDPNNEGYLKKAATMARDHAKLMRNGIDDLDRPESEDDERVQVHPIDYFIEKWEDSVIRIDDTTVTVDVISKYGGDITNRCLETSAIDRILYNYLNNAARFSMNQRVTLKIFSISDSVIRWIVSNTVGENQIAWLQNNTEGDLGTLYYGGTTRGGQGIGLSNCAKFVTDSFGLSSIDDAIRQKYVGADIIDGTYYGWFHWPGYTAADDEYRCDC